MLSLVVLTETFVKVKYGVPDPGLKRRMIAVVCMLVGESAKSSGFYGPGLRSR